MIIAIDGPAGAGKSTVAKILAQKLKFTYIDTGAMYRVLALKSLEKGISTSERNSLIRMARNTRINLVARKNGSLKVLMDGRDVSRVIRQPRITAIVSDVAKIKEVRKIMLVLQRRLGKVKNSVLDGRDIGTVVFPRAEKKFFLDANFKERVNRRFKELKMAKMSGVTLRGISADVKNRDTIDSTRKFAPLKKAKDAVYIDTTNLSIEEVVKRLLWEING
jgi:cytidylate kinase